MKNRKNSLRKLTFFCGILILTAIFSGLIILNDNPEANILELPSSSQMMDQEIEVLSATRDVIASKYGIVKVYDTQEYYNNDSNPVSIIYYCIEDCNVDLLDYIAAKTNEGASLYIEEMETKINGYLTFKIYLNSPLLPGVSVEIRIITYYLDMIRITTNGQEQIWSFHLSEVPFIPYKIQNIHSSFDSEGVYDPTKSTLPYNVTYTDLDTFLTGSDYNYTVIFVDNTNTKLEFDSINRRIDINPWGVLKVTEEHVISNNGYIPAYSYYFQIPKEASNFAAFDNIGSIGGISIEQTTNEDGSTINTINSDGETVNVSVNLMMDRSMITNDKSARYTVTYDLDFLKYYTKGLFTSGVNFNLNFMKTDLLIKTMITKIYLYSGVEVISSTINPDSIVSDDNSLVLIFNDNNVIDIESKTLFIEYTQDIYQFLLRPFIFILLFVLFFSAIAVIQNRVKSSEEFEGAYVGEVIPENDIREFVTHYEESNAIRIDLKEIEFRIARKKIPKKMGIKEKKTLQTKLKETQEAIIPFKKSLIDEGGRFSQLIRKLDLKETEFISNDDGIKLHEQRYKKGKLPSKSAYTTLKQQMMKNGDKIQRDIDKLINELKAYLI